MNLNDISLERTGAKWIWERAYPGVDYYNRYVEFRVGIDLTEAEADAGNARLLVSVDSEYSLRINGEFADCGQFDDFPDRKIYDTIDISSFLKAGQNTIQIDAYYQGKESFQYAHGTPGLLFAVLVGQNVAAASGSQILCRESQVFAGGEMEMITAQLGYTFRCDQSLEKDDGWKNAVEVEMPLLRELLPRPIDKLLIGKRIPTTVKTQGVFLRTDLRPDRQLARSMQSDLLGFVESRRLFDGDRSGKMPSVDGMTVNPDKIGENTGFYMIADLGREEAGLFDLEIEASAGTVVEIAYGEHLDDGRVRAFVGGRYFACRYVCEEGRLRFLYPYKRFAGRFLQLNFRNITQPLTIFYVGLLPADYPLARAGVFECPDGIHNAIEAVSRRTLELCMHEHYEDCPWREQGLYAMDSRSQALCGYYAFGEYCFPRASFSLLAQSIQDDAYLELCAPAHPPITIPCFSLAWIIESGEYVLYSGDTGFAKEYLPTLKRMLTTYLSDTANGLMKLQAGKRYWNYYEWADGLDNGKPPKDPDRLDSPLNLFLCLALKQAEFLVRHAGDGEFAGWCQEKLKIVRSAVHQTFWDEESGAYRTYIGKEEIPHFAELTQSLALLAGVVPESKSAVLRAALASDSNGWVTATLSHSIFKFEAMMGEPDRYGKIVMDRIARDWGHMLRSGATSFWETIEGAPAFDDAGSLCHGWSAVPLYFYYAYVLGVKPTEPGFAAYLVSPAACGFESAAGRVPLPDGTFLEVSWEMKNSELKWRSKIC